MDRQIISKDYEWIKSTILLFFLIVYSVIIITVISDNWNAIINDIHGYIPFGTKTIWNELADIIIRYLIVALVVSIIMVIYDAFVYYIWLYLPEPKYISNLRTYYLVVQAHRFANRLMLKLKLNILRSGISVNTRWFPTRNILILGIIKDLFGVLYLIIIPKGIITISSWLIIIIASFDFVLHIAKHFLGYYFYAIVGYLQSQNNESSIASIVVILTGVFVLIAFIIKMSYFQNRKTILKINIHETKNNLAENALELHYKAFRILYENILDIKNNTESVFHSRNYDLGAFLLSISRGELSFELENGEYKVKRISEFPLYKLNFRMSKVTDTP